MTYWTSSSATVTTIVNGEVVYPCRCGDVHRGLRASYEYAEHNCLHDRPLAKVEDEIVCIDCGKMFRVEDF